MKTFEQADAEIRAAAHKYGVQISKVHTALYSIESRFLFHTIISFISEFRVREKSRRWRTRGRWKNAETPMLMLATEIKRHEENDRRFHPELYEVTA